MVRFSRKEDYAVMLVSSLAPSFNKRLVPLSEVAKVHNISIFFLRNLANQLRKKGIVRAVEGKKGGYALAKDPKATQFGEVIQALSKKPIFSCCQNTPDGKCHVSLCPHGFSLRRLTNEFLEDICARSITEVVVYAHRKKS